MTTETPTQGAVAAPAGAAAPDGATPPAAPPSPVTEPDGLKLTWKEWQDFRKEQRSQVASLEAKLAAVTAAETKTPPPPAASSDGDLAAQVATLRRENALNRAFADHGIKPGKLRSFIEAQSARFAPDEVGAFVASAIEAAGGAPAPTATTTAATPAAPAPAPAVRAASPDPGPPGTPPVLPTATLDKIDAHTFKDMPIEARREMARKAMSRGASRDSNPFVKPKAPPH